jgi:large conductance mechanosensitive channel
MLKEFREFIKKGNLVALAVAFIMGATFAAVVTAFTNIILSFVAAIFGGTTQFVDLTWCLGGTCAQPGSSSSGRHETFTGTPIPVGAFVNAVITFVVVAFVLFLIVKAYNRFIAKEEKATTKPCPYCKSEIPKDATKCPNCTSELKEEAAPPSPPVEAPA